MVRSLWTAATGMNGQQSNLDAISHNLSNVNTTGYKQQRAEIEFKEHFAADRVIDQIKYSAEQQRVHKRRPKRRRLRPVSQTSRKHRRPHDRGEIIDRDKRKFRVPDELVQEDHAEADDAAHQSVKIGDRDDPYRGRGEHRKE